MVSRILAAVLTAVSLGGVAPAATHDTTGACGSLAGLRLPGTTVTSARVAATGEHDYCRIDGVMSPRTRFTLKLPTSGWTGQYVQQGCGGLCGAVPELDVPLFGFQCAAATDGRLALGATDSGHTGTDPADGSWGADPRLRVSFGLTSEHDLRRVSTQMMRAYYGRPPSYRYFDGCSTGGRQGLNLAQRYPADFDGILAGSPAGNVAPLALLNAWLARRNTGADGRPVLTPDLLAPLHAAVVRRCGDPVPDPRRCGFRPEHAAFLSPAQQRAVTAFYRGPVDEHGRSLYNGGMPYGSELEWANSFVGSDMARRLALSWFRNLAYPVNPPASFGLDDVRFTRATFDRLNVLGAAIYNANDPDLSAFRARGGRIILYHGWADSSIPPFSTVDYYAAVERRAGGFAASQRFSRLYLVAGGYHCLITAGELVFVEMLEPLMDWVERGVAPGTLSTPVLAVPGYALIRDASAAPFDALAPVRPVPGSLNAGYRYVGDYRAGS